MTTGYKYIKAWRKRTKTKLVNGFGGSCGICGYDKCFRALQFHHLDPIKKDFSISKAMSSNKWSNIVKEVSKCVMVCSNCHMEIHEGLVNIPSDIRRFDPSYECEEKKVVEGTPCIWCGKLKNPLRRFCSRICVGKSRIKGDWDKIDLEEAIRVGMKYVEIAKIVGVSDVAVKKRAKKLGLV